MTNGTFNPIIMVPMFIAYLILFVIAEIFLLKNKMNKKISIILLILSIIIPGFILGALANPVFAIQQIIMGFYNIIQNPVAFSMIFPSLLPMIIILLFFILSTILFGRTFCAYVCPLGSAQELISRVQFKSKIKKSKYIVNIPSKYLNYVRLGFFILMIIIALTVGIAIFQLINPFMGFTIFRNLTSITTIILPIILLAIVLISSLFIYRPWCRIFCPFGMIAWLMSRFSIFKLRRTADCTDCKACEKVCPTKESYRESKKSACYQCVRCIDICPNDAIKFKK
ncbi:MAG: 4Fe-4S binding protein [Candidatus Lokiarchaeota archaeon]|nr:4Fe-4S binding protein [Candidatus Lokiarchaeota archaeon]